MKLREMNSESVAAPASLLARAYAPIRAELAAAERIFDHELVGDIPFVNELCEYVRSYRGKMIRPAMLLLCGQAAGKLGPEHETLAAVVEMVHMATLVHDDVLDEADERRRRRTVASLSGNTTAVLLGDYLISHAFHLCSSIDRQFASRRIGATTNCVCEGELLQNHRSGDLGLSETEYFEIIRRKTGALTAVACELGAHFAGAGRSVSQAMYAYGMSAGMAFQIVDDVLDLIGDARAMGKTLGLDVALGKLTLPLIHALAQGGPEAAREIELACTAGARSERLREFLEQTGSVEYALAAAQVHVQEALERLSVVEPSPSKDSLVLMAEFITTRRI